MEESWLSCDDHMIHAAHLSLVLRYMRPSATVAAGLVTCVFTTAGSWGYQYNVVFFCECETRVFPFLKNTQLHMEAPPGYLPPPHWMLGMMTIHVGVWSSRSIIERLHTFLYLPNTHVPTIPISTLCKDAQCPLAGCPYYVMEAQGGCPYYVMELKWPLIVCAVHNRKIPISLLSVCMMKPWMREYVY